MPQIIGRLGISEQNYEVVSLVEREIQKYSPQARVAAYKNNKIYVEVESSVHLFELNFRRREILKVLNVIPGLFAPELKFFLKGSARPSAADRLKTSKQIAIERN